MSQKSVRLRDLAKKHVLKLRQDSMNPTLSDEERENAKNALKKIISKATQLLNGHGHDIQQNTA